MLENAFDSQYTLVQGYPCRRDTCGYDSRCKPAEAPPSGACAGRNPVLLFYSPHIMRRKFALSPYSTHNLRRITERIMSCSMTCSKKQEIWAFCGKPALSSGYSPQNMRRIARDGVSLFDGALEQNENRVVCGGPALSSGYGFRIVPACRMPLARSVPVRQIMELAHRLIGPGRSLISQTCFTPVNPNTSSGLAPEEAKKTP